MRRKDLMDAPQEQVYSKISGSSPNSSVLEAVSGRDLPDARPNESQRHALKDFARSLRARFSSHELVYLASAVEVQANEQRAEEEGRTAS
jgi:hypothetical protein